METESFSFDLPKDLIAQEPLDKRDSSKLLVLNSKENTIEHSFVYNFINYLKEGDLLVFNESKVRHSRFVVTYENKQTEVLLLNKFNNGIWGITGKKLGKIKNDTTLYFPENVVARFFTKDENSFLSFDNEPDENYFEKFGRIPLPPYIKRSEKPIDKERYQTVYAKKVGSSAAPTAGLHFTKDLFDALKAKSIITCKICLHVGLGTFNPIRSLDIRDHKMHEESYEICKDAADKINLALKNKRRIIAIGTTSLRCIEASYIKNKCIVEEKASTSIYFYPGINFNVFNGLFTNFHTPKSSLIVLCSAFAGKERLLEAYKTAVEKKYRFFSYGDAMLILN